MKPKAMTPDLLTRLSANAAPSGGCCLVEGDLLREAIAEIERLRAALEQASRRAHVRGDDPSDWVGPKNPHRLDWDTCPHENCVRDRALVRGEEPTR